MTMGASVLPLFKQIGIYDEFIKRGIYFNQMHMLMEDLSHVHTMDGAWMREL
jgi:hypothetical protein